MSASKEFARSSKDAFLKIVESSPSLLSTFAKDIEHVLEFHKAAERKLPSAKAYERERQRRRR